MSSIYNCFLPEPVNCDCWQTARCYLRTNYSMNNLITLPASYACGGNAYEYAYTYNSHHMAFKEKINVCDSQATFCYLNNSFYCFRIPHADPPACTFSVSHCILGVCCNFDCVLLLLVMAAASAHNYIGHGSSPCSEVYVRGAC